MEPFQFLAEGGADRRGRHDVGHPAESTAADEALLGVAFWTVRPTPLGYGSKPGCGSGASRAKCLRVAFMRSARDEGARKAGLYRLGEMQSEDAPGSDVPPPAAEPAPPPSKSRPNAWMR